MKIIVALGNPGLEFENTRHNLGFLLMDEFLKKYNLTLDKQRYNGFYDVFNIDGQKVILAKPQTYMNLSGGFVQSITHFYKINPEDILVLVDDKDMDFGKIRIKNNTSSAGQNGIKDIENKLNTKSFYRLKFGIGSDKNIPTKNYVLGKMNEDQRKIFNEKKEVAIQAIKSFILSDAKETMNKYNGK